MDFEKMAEDLAKRLYHADELSEQDFAEEILTALRAAAFPPKDHVRDGKGVDRLLLGTLPVTADGCVVGNGARVWAYVQDEPQTILQSDDVDLPIKFVISEENGVCIRGMLAVEGTYGAFDACRAAAEAARKPACVAAHEAQKGAQ